MGKSEKRQKTENIVMRVTSEEKAVIAEWARDKGLSISSLLRTCVWNEYMVDYRVSLTSRALKKAEKQE